MISTPSRTCSHLQTRLLALVVLIWKTTAFPAGAGSCPGGMAAVGGSHLAGSTVINGTLEDNEINFSVDGDEMRVDRPLTVFVDQPTPFLLRAPYNGGGIKGFLIRISSATGNFDLTNSLSPLSAETEEEEQRINTKLEGNYCGDQKAAGLTHKDAEPKYLIRGEILITEVIFGPDITLDVTAVMENTAEKSEFYYTQYKLKAIAQEKPQPTESSDGPQLITISNSGAVQTKTTITLLVGVVATVAGWIMP
ncbi:expressed unknown protein [Seminavis robusta]|uniref:Uncharacterized protein n=1 Tax=Seminavis robusta TaxID=568900 RepID=A0A9N8F1C9_9STRA|nr:expressed unknown protein [Seminavis robusta]|eukprot:Sro2503_g329600.1 n/a (251) ;mRNA; f:11098-11850